MKALRCNAVTLRPGYPADPAARTIELSRLDDATYRSRGLLRRAARRLSAVVFHLPAVAATEVVRIICSDALAAPDEEGPAVSTAGLLLYGCDTLLIQVAGEYDGIVAYQAARGWRGCTGCR